MVNLDEADAMLELLNEVNHPRLRRYSFELNGVEREYFLRLPKNFDSEKEYWPLVSVHGGNGNGLTFFLSKAILEEVDGRGMPAIVISPSFSNDDFQASRFPDLGEGAFLIQVLKHLRQK